MEKITKKEEEVMNLFWEHGPMFVRDLVELYPDPKPHFNTISTMVRALESKGYVDHKSFGPTYQYFAAVSRDEFGKLTLRGIIGLILIPDNFFNDIKHLYFYNEPSNWDSNVLTIEEWAAFAAKGCVFLPAAGSRSHNNAVYSGSGCYWSSSSPSDPSDSNAEIKAFYLYFGTGNYKLKVDNSTTRIYGHSVRLVHPVE